MRRRRRDDHRRHLGLHRLGDRARRGIADTAILVILFGLLAIADFILSRFVETGDVAVWVAIVLAAGLALDAIYGLMAPERQRQRDRKLRRLMRRRA